MIFIYLSGSEQENSQISVDQTSSNSKDKKASQNSSTDVAGGVASFLGAEMSNSVEFLERDELQ